MPAVLRSFSQLFEVQQRIVILKSHGASHNDISRQIMEEYNVRYSKNTINQYFAAGGLLEQALHDYSAMTADEWLKEAHMHAKLYSKTAIDTLAELLNDKYDPTVRLGAAKALANKYLPDRQNDRDRAKQRQGLPDVILEHLTKIASV